MKKRKIDINELKKRSIRGKKNRSINVKYQTVLAYFKQKDVHNLHIFEVQLVSLINELLNQFNTLEIAAKIENNNYEPLKFIPINQNILQLDLFYLKALSSQFPIRQISECLYIQKHQKTNKIILRINPNKLMVFFKHLRNIYPQFCGCIGQKCILQNNDLKTLYQQFKIEWNKNEQKGRLSYLQKVEKKICRSLFFIGVIIENNIFYAIDQRETKIKQDLAQPGTKSEKKKNIKDQTYQFSSTYSFGSADLISNFSMTLKSQKSNQEDLALKYDYSQKSQKIISRFRYNLFNKAQIKNLRLKVYKNEKIQVFEIPQRTKYDIDLLSNEVENLIIQQAFKLQKLKDACQKPYSNQNHYYFVNYMQQQPQHPYYQISPSNSGNLQQIRKSFDFYNLVETRKINNRFHIKKQFN